MVTMQSRADSRTAPFQRLAVPQRLLGALALEELADLPAERRGRLQEVLVHAEPLPAEELDDAEGLEPARHREAEGGPQPRPQRRLVPREVRVHQQPVQVDGRVLGPDPAGQALAALERRLLRHGRELVGARAQVGRRPARGAAQHPRRLVHGPERAHVPAELGADDGQDLGHCRVEVRRAGEDAADGDLGREPPLGVVALRGVLEGDDAAPDGAVLDDREGRVLGQEEAAVLPPHHLVVELHGAARLQGPDERAFGLRVGRAVRVGVVDQVVHVPAQHLLGVEAERPLGGLVDEGAASLGVDAVDAEADRVEQRRPLPPLPVGAGQRLPHPDLGRRRPGELDQDRDVALRPLAWRRGRRADDARHRPAGDRERDAGQGRVRVGDQLAPVRHLPAERLELAHRPGVGRAGPAQDHPLLALGRPDERRGRVQGRRHQPRQVVERARGRVLPPFGGVRLREVREGLAAAAPSRVPRPASSASPTTSPAPPGSPAGTNAVRRALQGPAFIP